ncbi:Uncharacterised protein [Citrobacter braakii]|uniref:hypothetical protein n=1 Tax=Citrobacter braakii TaxID=57706 RepID=UPI000E02AEAE|nr:hypothetical protein [Citrobacter braakii]STJ26703.1 Uncharacterised protein [Citrobacter braakii]
MTKKNITSEGLHTLIIELEQTAYRLNGTNSGYLMADVAAVLREFYAVEPVADVVEWRKEGEERTCDIRWRRFDVSPGPLYSIPQLQSEQQNIPKNIPVIPEQPQQSVMKAVCAVCGENCTNPHNHPMKAVPVEPPISAEFKAARNTLKFLRYTWTGGEHWRPPLGLPPESVTGIDYKKLVEEISSIVFGNLEHVEHLPIVIRATFGRFYSWS